jgi:ribosomal protein S18 acetylase RimI-like enzyme
MKRKFIENKIRLLSKSEKIPYDLLLLADETVEAIDRYVRSSEIFVFEQGGVTTGVYVLYSDGKTEVEIKNIAVLTSLQGMGVGSFLLNDAIHRARGHGYRSIIVGTPDIANRLLEFYEKAGFVKYDRKINFYIDNYSEAIIENNVQLKDMIMLKKEL